MVDPTLSSVAIFLMFCSSSPDKKLFLTKHEKLFHSLFTSPTWGCFWGSVLSLTSSDWAKGVRTWTYLPFLKQILVELNQPIFTWIWMTHLQVEGNISRSNLRSKNWNYLLLILPFRNSDNALNFSFSIFSVITFSWWSLLFYVGFDWFWMISPVFLQKFIFFPLSFLVGHFE